MKKNFDTLYEKLGGTYREENGHLIPDIALPEQTNYQIGKYGRMHLDYIKNHRRGRYTTFLTEGKLNARLHEIDLKANEMLETIIPRLAAERNIDENLKARDMLRWVAEMNNINVSISEHSHSYTKTVVEPQCLVGGYTTYSCACGYSYNADQTPAKGHTEVIDPAVPATPTSTGLTEGKHCSDCGKVIIAQSTTPKDYSSIAESVTFSLTNNLSQEYSYISSMTLYTKCKIESVDYSVTASSAERITLKINFMLKKTHQGNTSMSNIKFRYTLYRDGVAVKTGEVLVTGAHLDTLYEKTLTYTGEPGTYTMTCESVWY